MDEIELNLKRMIIAQYGSLKKFCEKIDMPWTTLNSILKRGVANSNITNILKITNELKIDTESLAYGRIINKSNALATNAVATTGDMELPIPKIPQIIQYYNNLNDIGKYKATERVKELTYVPEYNAEPTHLMVNAAHEIENSSQADKKHDEDIMDDENF